MSTHNVRLEVMKLLEKDIDKRYARGAEIAADLRRCAEQLG